MALLGLQRQLFGVTLSMSAFSFANGLIGVFIPLVILDAGAPLWQVPAFYMTYAVAKLIINYPIARFVVLRRGVHAAFALGFSAAVVELAALQAFVHSQATAWLAVAAVALAFVNGSLWLASHLHISSIIDTSTKSSSMATIEIANQVLGVAAPMVGGFVGALFGPSWLIGVALVFLAFAFVPLRLIGRLDAESAHRGDTVRYSLAGAPKRDLVANFSWNIESAVGVTVWPIFLALEIAGYRDIGIITAIASVFMVLSMWIAGRRGDQGHYRGILAEAAVASTIINILRMIVTGTLAVAVVTAAYRSTLSYAQVTWASGYYGHAKRNGAQWIMAMEIICDVAYLVLWGTLLVLVLAFDQRVLFVVAFSLAAIAAWGCLAITDEKRKPAFEKGE